MNSLKIFYIFIWILLDPESLEVVAETNDSIGDIRGLEPPINPPVSTYGSQYDEPSDFSED